MCRYCCSPLVVPVVMVTAILPSSFLSSPHFSLTAFSINSLQLLLSFAVVLQSPPPLSRSLLAQSSHRIICLPRLLFPPLSGHLLSLLIFIPLSFHFSGTLQPTPHQILLKTYTPTFTLNSSHRYLVVSSSFIRSLQSLDSSYPVVSANLHLLPLFLC